ncbi:glycosyl hydrolase 5 family protein-like [Andrographis paniculata]|uniref:glycosyl hydrolase 5 family protein-like n=1 Tax=Andrographis paniculata TaxID=175694 RepID=UPI0021E8CE9E|nr:glycosyl hydrolase 5 family protein-like [Andrographis paniculata]
MGRLFCFLLCILISMPLLIVAQPLSTDSRWIVNSESGQRVKLACVSWPSHLEVVVAEGLSKKAVDEISQDIRDMGFNCVRLTWPLFLFTNDTLASITVRQSLRNLGLFASISGFQANNPSIIDLSLIDAYKEVVASLAKKQVMIILDNHTSKPGWCCSTFDGNGFFGDEFFNPEVWIKGLTTVATTFNDTKYVVAMSLRNELRGPRQNVDDWYRYMQQGAEAVHAANPNVLVILSGLQYDRDLSFLVDKPVALTFSNKLVFELHWYGFSDGQAWKTGNPNEVCGRLVSETMTKAGFLLTQGFPLFLSEFGMDMRGTNINDNRYMNCFMGWAAEQDVDWALWTLTGSYYLRDGIAGFDETYGVYDWNWCNTRNQSILRRISSLQYPFRGPGYAESREHRVLFHPMTGLCVKRISILKPLILGPCTEAEAWSYSPQQTLTIKGTYFCLQADGLGKPVKLGITCSDGNSKWEAISDSKMQLSTNLEAKKSVCLDVDSDNKVVTNDCKCLDNRNNKCDPGSQWFKIIDSTRRSQSGRSDFFHEIGLTGEPIARTIISLWEGMQLTIS